MGALLDREEAAARLHVSHMTVRRLGREGFLDEIRVGKRAVRITFTASRIAVFLTARWQKP